MKTQELTQEQISKIQKFFDSLRVCDLYINDYVDANEIDLDNPFESIRDIMQDNNGLDVEIIYYSNAIQYLKDNDPSLSDSLRIADEMGFDLKSLNSEVLASLLATEILHDEFYALENEINSFFEELLND